MEWKNLAVIDTDASLPKIMGNMVEGEFREGSDEWGGSMSRGGGEKGCYAILIPSYIIIFC